MTEKEKQSEISIWIQKILKFLLFNRTRPDTRLPQSRVGGQGLYMRSLDHLGRSSEAKNRKNPKKVKCDGRTDRRTDGRTKRGVESRSTRLKRGVMEMLNAVVYINRNKNLKQRKEWGRLINRYTQTVKSTWGLEGGLKAYRNHCSLHLVMRRWFDQMADFPPGSYCLTLRKIIKLYL